jgi:hypothetical protein
MRERNAFEIDGWTREEYPAGWVIRHSLFLPERQFGRTQIRSWGSLTEPMQPKYNIKKHLL